MAIQAQLYPENLGLPLMGGGGGPNYSVSQDWFFNNNQILNNFANNNNCFNEISSNNNLQQQKQQQQQQFQFQQQQQQQEVLLQLQQQYLLQLQNQQQRNSCDNNNDEGFVFMGSSKNCTPTTTTASTTTSDSDYRVPLNISPSFADTLEKQRQEIDRFITLQNERLKLALQEQRKQQLTTMVRKIEARAKQIIQEKDEEITKALKRRYELEEVIRKMGVENQEWQRIAAENEAMVVSLNNTLQQIKQQQQMGCVTSSSSCSSNEVGDAESCCNEGEGEGNFGNKKRARVEKAEDFETEELKKKKKRGVMCKVCDSRESCVLLLPCRHLCCCKGCVDFIDVCPVCNAMKKASIEALFS